MLDTLTRIMASRDGATADHARRVQRYARALAIPDRVLYKPGPLTREEYEQVKHHAVIGAEILIGIDSDGPLAAIVRHHHENWDGSGYPDGLRGEAIPLGARLLAIVDCYDALTSERPYRRGLPHDRALAMLLERRGVMYDPALTDAFAGIVHRVRASAPPRKDDCVPPYAFRLRSATRLL